LAEKFVPGLAHVEIPVVLSGNVEFLRLDLFQDVVPELYFDRVAELGQIAAENEKIRARFHRLNFLDGTHGFFDEPRIDIFWIQMGVGKPGEAERGLRAMRQRQRIDDRKPAVRRGSGGAPGQQRSM
jgi:hypothetical protein